MTIHELIGYQYVPQGEHLKTLTDIYHEKGHDICLTAVDAYLYGIIVGKRMERARKKRL